MAKKQITLSQLNAIHPSMNMVDDLVDQVMQGIDHDYGKSNEGLSTKILSMFVNPGGQRIQWEEDVFVEELSEKRSLGKQESYEILDRMQKAGILRCTNGNRYEMGNNTLAQRVEKKVEAENSLIRNMKLVIRDHLSRNELLDEQYLNHIAPFLPRLELDEEQQSFVVRSENAIQKERRRRRNLGFLGLFLLLSLTTWALVKTIENTRLYNAEKGNTEKLKNQTVELENLNDSLDLLRIAANYRADSFLILRYRADSAFQVADRLRIEAIIALMEVERAKDSIQAEQERYGVLLARSRRLEREATAAKENADQKRKEAVVAQGRAEAAKAESDLASQRAIALNAAIRSLNIDNPKIQALVAREAFNLFEEHFQSPYQGKQDKIEANHPYLFDALSTSMRRLDTDMEWSVLAHEGSVNDIILDPEGQSFYTAGSDGLVQKWSVDSWNLIGKPEMKSTCLYGIDFDHSYQSLSLSPDRTKLMIAGAHDRLQIFDFSENYVNQDLLLPRSFSRDQQIYTAAFTKNEQTVEALALGSEQYFISYGNESRAAFTNDLKAYKKAFSRANTILDFREEPLGMYARNNQNGIENTIEVFFIRGDKINKMSIPLEAENQYQSFKEPTAINGRTGLGGELLAVGFENGHLLLVKVDFNSGRVRNVGDSQQVFKSHTAPITDIAFSENLMAVSSMDGTVSVWDLRLFADPTYQPIILKGHGDWVQSLCFVQGERMLIAGTQDGYLYFWNLNTTDYAQEVCQYLCESEDDDQFDQISIAAWEKFFGKNIEWNAKICQGINCED